MSRPEHTESTGGEPGRDPTPGGTTAESRSARTAGDRPSGSGAGGGDGEAAGSGAWSVAGIGLLVVLFVIAAVATVHSIFATLVG